MLTKPSIAVLVDCWTPTHYEIELFYNDIIKFLNNTPKIKTIILASYDVDDDNLSTTNLWYKNSMTELDHSQKTADIILNYINTDKLQIAMTAFDDFTNYLGKHPEIKNIYFMGQSWNNCIHKRPIGIESCGNINKNIIVNQECVWNAETNESLQIEKDRVHDRYVKIKDNIYQIICYNPPNTC